MTSRGPGASSSPYAGDAEAAGNGGSGGKLCEGTLCLEVDSEWAEYYCWIRGGRFQAHKSTAYVPRPGASPPRSSGSTETVLEFSIGQNKCHAKAIELPLGSAAKLSLVAPFLPPSPRFVEVNLLRKQRRITIAFKDERERNYWVSLLNGTPASKLVGGNANAPASSNRAVTEEREVRAISADSIAAEEEEGDADVYCCSSVPFLRLKVDTFVRLIKVVLSFPFVIVIASLNLSPKYVSMIPTWAMRVMNMLIYAVPVVYVNALLAQTNSESLQRLILGVYLAIYLVPVAYVVIQKITVSQSTSKIEEGTFCFRPAREMRWTYSNVFAVGGFVLEWLQHCLYCFPLGIVQKQSAQTVQDSPPYIPYIYYFWISVVSVFVCALILILNAVLKGKKHYNFQRFGLMWLFLFTVGGPGFVTIVTILFMSLWCDYTGDIPVLMQDRTIVCWDPYHTRMAVCGLVSLAIFLIQMTLLPSGTYKETMRNSDLDVMFVPVYLQGHYVLKAIFCGIYVTFYNDDWVRVVLLTFINLLLLALMCWMQPCSVPIINSIRQTFFVCAVISGFQSLIYVANTKLLENADTYPIKALFMTTLATNCLVIVIGMALYHFYTRRSTKFQIARTFLDLEWQVSKGGSVHPRVLEPLISLTLSSERGDEEIAKNYIGQLVWLISYPNMRVQFQSAWGIANLALVDEDARRKIHEAGGTKALFEWFNDMHPVVQLEALAAMANLTLSYSVTAEMVSTHSCVPLFINLVSASKMSKHAQFASIALGNIARSEAHRAVIISSGGVPMLAGLLISSEYATRQYACLALANLALSPSQEIVEAFRSKRLLDKLVKMATRKETETQREVTALLRNLSCHEVLRPLLVARNAMSAVAAAKDTVYPEVIEWAAQMERLLRPYVVADSNVNGSTELPVYFTNPSSPSSPTSKRTVGGIFEKLKPRQAAAATLLDPAAMSMLSTVELLSKMSPLEGCVTWSTWGSKLDSIFSPIFAALPSIQSSQLYSLRNTPVEVNLAHGLSEAASRRANLKYTVISRPQHGKLSEYTTTASKVTYTPDADFVGSDFFTYRLQVGSVNSGIATVALYINDEGAGKNSADAKRKSKILRGASFRGGPAAPSSGPRRGVERGASQAAFATERPTESRARFSSVESEDEVTNGVEMSSPTRPSAATTSYAVPSTFSAHATSASDATRNNAQPASTPSSPAKKTPFPMQAHVPSGLDSSVFAMRDIL